MGTEIPFRNPPEGDFYLEVHGETINTGFTGGA
jgi:hypothetical protein